MPCLRAPWTARDSRRDRGSLEFGGELCSGDRRCRYKHVRTDGIGHLSSNRQCDKDIHSYGVVATGRRIEGRLDDPISRYIGGVAEGDNITLRHLAGMQSGLVDYTENEQFVTDFLVDPRAPLSPEQLLSYIDGMPLKFRPGTEVSYSNTNTVLLGLVVEKVTGKPLREVIKSKVTDPLGMSHTVLPISNEFPSPHAQGYTDQTTDGSVVTATDWNLPGGGQRAR